ncbi:hypothetical protein niasHS_007610 [Heterodera schachtii]|uniref:Uncharacterized protein n=1 Tax=Heterodera schachtii TaxID=97005 RepID=A0ABD2JP59_HETSC
MGVEIGGGGRCGELESGKFGTSAPTEREKGEGVEVRGKKTVAPILSSNSPSSLLRDVRLNSRRLADEFAQNAAKLESGEKGEGNVL